MDDYTKNVYLKIIENVNIFKVDESSAYKDLRNEIQKINPDLLSFLSQFENIQMITFSSHENNLRDIISHISEKSQKALIEQKINFFVSKTKPVPSNKSTIDYVESQWKQKPKIHYQGTYDLLRAKYQWDYISSSGVNNNPIIDNQTNNIILSEPKKPKFPSILAKENKEEEKQSVSSQKSSKTADRKSTRLNSSHVF